jgi:phage gp45-like
MSARTQRYILKLVNDAGKVQLLQVEGELLEDGGLPDVLECEGFATFGFSANPPIGSDVIVTETDGDSAQGVALSVQNRDHRPKGLATGDVCLHGLNGLVQLLLTGGLLHLGSQNPSDFVALASKVLTELNALVTWANTHVHTSAAPGSPTTAPTIPKSAPSSVASTVVKCA